MRKQILFVLFSLATLSIHADEGMWMLTDLKTQNAVAMRELGLEIPIEEVYDANGLSLKDAVVHFGGGCTGEIISSEGLVLTNHHCGYGAIQQHSNVEHDYLTDGFWAMNRDAELPTPGLTVTFIDRILDVTDYVNEQLKKDPANCLAPHPEQRIRQFGVTVSLSAVFHSRSINAFVTPTSIKSHGKISSSLRALLV